VAAAYEVPPHHEFLVEGRAAEQDHPRRARPGVGEVQFVTAGALIGQIGDRERGARDLDHAAVQEHAVFERRVDIERQFGAGRKVDLRTEQRCECVHRRAGVAQLTEEHPQSRRADHPRGRGVVREVAVGVACVIGQRDPQLDAVQDRGRLGRHLGVADARARGHEVEFARTHHRMHATAVAMLDLAGEKPTDGL